MALEPAKRLGRGLDALLGAHSAPAPAEEPRRTVALDLIHRNPRNPRRNFRAEDLRDLADSIRAHGIVQPLVVRPLRAGAEGYEIVAGERRWRAAQMAGLHDVPITIVDVSDRQALEMAIVENVQRTDLNPVEEARGSEALIEEVGDTQGDLGATIGPSRVHVTNTLRLLRLPPSVLAQLEAGEISAGHGRALVAAADPAKLADQVSERGLSVRETERLAQAAEAERPTRVRSARRQKELDIQALERQVSDALGLSVDIRHARSGRGEVRISYRNVDQMEDVCRKLRG